MSQPTEADPNQLNELLNRSIHRAQMALASDDGPPRFAMTLTDGGKWLVVEPSSEDPSDTVEEQDARVLRAILARRESLTACSIVSTVDAGSEDEEGAERVIQVAIEHAAGTSLRCSLPYWEGEGGVEYGALRVGPLAAAVWN